jgi:putative membrane protein
MKRKLLLSFVCIGAFLCVQTANLAFAQSPGGMPAGQNPSTPSTLPGQTPRANNPGPNGPLGPNSPETTAPAKVDDKKFLKQAAMGGMAEVELGKLAAQKASSDNVKQFAQQMVVAHTKANDELKQVANKENIAIPDALDSKHESQIAKLSKLSGLEFDKAYAKEQLKDHKTDVRDFSAEAQGGTDPNVKAFASNTLPMLQQHLELAKNLNK